MTDELMGRLAENGRRVLTALMQGKPISPNQAEWAQHWINEQARRNGKEDSQGNEVVCCNHAGQQNAD